MAETAVKMPARVRISLNNAARRGAKLLDKHGDPVWFNKVRTTDLEMRDPCNCVFGQLAASDLIYQLAKMPGDVGYLPTDQAYAWANEGTVGMDDYYDRLDPMWEALQEAWLSEIRNRRIAYKHAPAVG